MQRWINKKIEAIEYLGNKCTKCDLAIEKSHYSVFEFHHKNPLTKDYDWNKLRLRPIDDIHRELNKCILVCANCHRLIHAELQAHKLIVLRVVIYILFSDFQLNS